MVISSCHILMREVVEGETKIIASQKDSPQDGVDTSRCWCDAE